MATTAIIPPTKNGNLLKIGLIASSVAGLSSVVRMSTKEKKVITKIDYIDYEQNIKSSINNINDIDKTITKSLKDIKELKKDFTKEFAKYKNIIPGYTELLVKLDTLEKDLITKSNIAKEYDQKLQTVLKENNVKVKRLEEKHVS